MDTTTPKPTANKNQKSICLPSSLNFPLNKSCNAVILNYLRQFISRSNIPVRSAIVPPETPGITLAEPIPIPFNKLLIN